MNLMQNDEKAIKYFIDRARLPYRRCDDALFCTQTLGKRYPYAAPLKSEHGPDWAVYMFKTSETDTPIEVWAVSVDLPDNWEEIQLPIEACAEPQEVYDNSVCFCLSGQHANEGMVKKCIAIALKSVIRAEEAD
jgi:hypothetical protein